MRTQHTPHNPKITQTSLPDPATAQPVGRGWPSLVLYGLLATLAGLVWLNVSSGLAATGRDIAGSETRRQDLLDRRSHALMRHAAATDPGALETRAEALGFQRRGSAMYLPSHRPEAVGGDLQLAVEAPLTIANRAGGIPTQVEDQPSGVSEMLLSIGAAAPASASVIQGAGGGDR